MTDHLHLRLEAQIDSLTVLDEAVEEFGTEQDWAPGLLFQVKLALEELVVNIINHGYEESDQSFEITIKSEARALRIEITDEARPFNPLTGAPPPDVEATVDERRVGGLGVHLVQTMMDEMHYERTDGKNRLILVKEREER